ncbi:MAG: hypothetical protein PHV93_04605 [Candidatus Pacebacteria bacterium]|nr:hypothetical protein [Candidatus Paceibacterota bacterium]
MTNQQLEAEALLIELEGMLAANKEREHRGESLAYPESAFIQLAKDIRALKTVELAATAERSTEQGTANKSIMKFPDCRKCVKRGMCVVSHVNSLEPIIKLESCTYYIQEISQ